MADTKTILRYAKARELFRRAEGGERAAAKAAMDRISRDHPEIEAEADAYEAAQDALENPVTPTAESAGFQTPFGFKVNWANVGKTASDVLGTAREFARKVAEAERGERLVEEVEDDVKITRTGNVHLVFKFSPELLGAMAELNTVQRESFLQAMHELTRDHLESLFTALDDD